MNEAKSTTGVLPSTRLPTESGRSGSARNGLLCALVVAICVLLTYPVANMPFMDDFSYTKTALDFARTGHFLYNGWATAMLGWQVPWGALFIKIFGFSFTAVRLSTLPIAMASVYLFHQILRRFGINPRNAMLGALTMSLSPLCLPMSASYMTDVPGLFVILVCIYMCQRAAVARSDKAALVWLCSAMLVNVAGGTVRQIAWLGALVMIPSTAWLLRERRGMKIAGVLTWIAGAAGIAACLHWFSNQPYSVPEHIIPGPFHIKMLAHLGAQLLKTCLCLLLLISPILIAWLPTALRLTNKARLRFICTMGAVVALAVVLYINGHLEGWLMPWLTPVLVVQGVLLPEIFGVASITSRLWMTLGISFVVLASMLIFVEQITIQERVKAYQSTKQMMLWNELAWILVPFSLGYVMLLAPIGAFDRIQDRYVLGLVPIAIVFVLKLYQERVSAKTPAVSVVALAVFAAYAVGGSHDLFAESRALVSTVRMLQTSGVPRRSVLTGLSRVGLASDGWAQVEGGGHINDPRIQVPAGAYNPSTSDSKLQAECTSWISPLTPAIIPKYFVVLSPMSCFAPTQYPPVHYKAWLPPFHRALYVQQLMSSLK